MISYEVMKEAVGGDPIAAGRVLEHFDHYIDQLCTHAFVDDCGHVTYGVDGVRKTQLQGKLLSAILRFTL